MSHAKIESSRQGCRESYSLSLVSGNSRPRLSPNTFGESVQPALKSFFIMISLVLGDSFGKSIDSFDGIVNSFYIKNPNVNAAPTKKEFFFVIFSEDDTILEKIVICDLEKRKGP